MPANFKVLHLETYNELGNPIDHLESFRTLILLHQASDETLYHAFPSTLKGWARHWYFILNHGSIDFLMS